MGGSRESTLSNKISGIYLMIWCFLHQSFQQESNLFEEYGT